MKELESEIAAIKERNKKVELDKAWETSWTRKIVILVLTYIVIMIFFIFAKLPNPFINAIVPAIAFVLSTLSVSVIKRWWVRRKAQL